MSGNLTGIRILDLTSVIMGPYATQILGDMGADVIKIEAPEGDIMRHMGHGQMPGMGPVHVGINRNKRSVMLDLKQDSARSALLQLAASADVFLHSIRPAAIERLGLGYEDLRKVRPDIVYCSAIGYGSDGPYVDKPAYDDIIQGISGSCALNSLLAGEPRFTPTIFADKSAGLTIAYALLSALFHRERTGQGQSVEVPMFETVVSFIMLEHLWDRSHDFQNGAIGYPRLLNSQRRPFRTKNGYLCVLPYTDRHWRDIVLLANRPHLAEDPRFISANARSDNFEELYAQMGQIMLERTSEEWLGLMEPKGIPVACVNKLEDVLADPHLTAVEMFRHTNHPTEGSITQVKPPVKFSATPSLISRPATRLGEHSTEVLREAGMSLDDIANMRATGATL